MVEAVADWAKALLTGQVPPSAYLVYAAVLCYVAGFLLRRQIALRLLVLAGSSFYLSYYYFFPDTPLWDAIISNGLVALANVVGLLAFLAGRSPRLDAEGREVLEACREIAPALARSRDVKRLMRGHEIRTAAAGHRATRLGERPSALYLLTRGDALIENAQTRRRLPAPCFLAEIAFVTGGSASADATIEAGSRYVRFERDELARRLRASPELERTVLSLITSDVCRKLTNGPAPALPSVDVRTA